MGTEETLPSSKDADIISDLESKIIRQIEYYFGNYNLGKDKFLRDQIKLDDGWIPLETMVKFNRLKILSEDFAVINVALKKSPSQLMEVHEDGTKIRRSVEKPLPDNTNKERENIDGRSVYVKGFKPETSLDELLEFFKQYGNAENIFMRRRPNKKFKGSVYVTFPTKEDAKEFLDLKDLKYKTLDLSKEDKPSYLKRKTIIYEERKQEKEKEKQLKLDSKKDIKTETEGPEPELVKDCLLKLTGLSEKTMWEHIKEELGPFGTIAFVDYRKGEPMAIVRFTTGVASTVLEKAFTEEDGVKKIKICGNQVTGVCIDGEEETQYWTKISAAKSNMKQRVHPRKGGWSNRGGFKNNRGGGRGGYGKRDRRRRDDDDEKHVKKESNDEPPAKMLKKEGSPATERTKTTETAMEVQEN